MAYGRYVDTLEPLESHEDCFQCKSNREILEHAWQVVANEFYDPHGQFSQVLMHTVSLASCFCLTTCTGWESALQWCLTAVPAVRSCACIDAHVILWHCPGRGQTFVPCLQAHWAGELQKTLQANGGALKTKRALYRAAKSMIASLDDQYSQYLEPGAFRAAIRKPTKAELDYLSEQAVGTLQHQHAMSQHLAAVLCICAAAELDVHAPQRLAMGAMGVAMLQGCLHRGNKHSF